MTRSEESSSGSEFTIISPDSTALVSCDPGSLCHEYISGASTEKLRSVSTAKLIIAYDKRKTKISNTEVCYGFDYSYGQERMCCPNIDVPKWSLS